MTEPYYQSRRLVIVAAEPMSPEKVIAEVRCDRCRHWMWPEWFTGQPKKQRVCGAVSPVEGESTERFVERHAGVSAYDDRGQLYTAPDFGCALFSAVEAKEGT